MILVMMQALHGYVLSPLLSFSLRRPRLRLYPGIHEEGACRAWDFLFLARFFVCRETGNLDYREYDLLQAQCHSSELATLTDIETSFQGP